MAPASIPTAFLQHPLRLLRAGMFLTRHRLRAGKMPDTIPSEIPAVDNLPVDVADHGRNFAVLVVEGWAFKVPKRRVIADNLEMIAETHRELAHIDGMLPAAVREDVLVMPEAPGERGDTVNDPAARKDVARIKSEAADEGYEVLGSAETAWFWDGQRAYYVDLSHVVLPDGTRTNQPE